MATSAERGRAPSAAPQPEALARDGAQRRAHDDEHRVGERRRPGWFEWLTLATFAAVCCWLIVVNLHYAVHGLKWTGIDGEFPVDQMQFLAWIQDASRHVLTSDLFVLRPTGHVYLQPMFALSGGLVALGVPSWVALIAWKPVAIVAVFFAIWVWCGRLLEGRWERRAALVLALFAGGGGVLGDEWLPFMAWGYPHAVISLALIVAALLAYDRAYREQRLSVVAPAMGFLASWVHPWQGEILIVILGAVELVRLNESLRAGLVRSLRQPVLTVAATAIPLIYYGILGRIDLAWRLGQGALLHSWPLDRILVPLIPLLVLSAPAYLRRPRGVLQASAMAWPIAAFIVYGVNSSGFAGAPQHAWVGIAVPLGVLAVQAVRSFWLPLLGRVRLPWRARDGGSTQDLAGRMRDAPAGRAVGVLIAVLAVAALTIPGSASTMSDAYKFIGPATHNQNLLASSEVRALHYLANDPERGGVLSSPYLGDSVPGATGRRVYDSDDWRWSQPNAFQRAHAARRLLAGELAPVAARHVVLQSGARFVLQNCGSRADLERTLRPIISSVRRFGCATVFRVT
ncbi:MAG: hypothetical protein ACTHQQ_15050 [Solirubrobacteraceae bacterium]